MAKGSLPLRIRVSEAGDAGVTIALAGDVDVYTTPEVLRELRTLLERGRTSVVVNLEKVTYIDSTGLGALLEVMRRARSLGGGLSIVTQDRRTVHLFESFGLSKVFPIFPDESSARVELESHRRSPLVRALASR